MIELPKRCKLIYRPKGRAGEYAPLALNLYKGCGGDDGKGCGYCFGPQVLRMSRDEFHGSPRTRSAGFLIQLSKEAALCQEAGLRARVLLCFTCDPYQPINAQHRLARKAIVLLHAAGLNVQVLTKAGRASLADLDLFVPDDTYAATLTFSDSESGRKMSRLWEPHMDGPGGRLAALRAFHAAGVQTWASLEPIISTEQTLTVIEQSYAFVDVFKAGKLNYHAHAQTINWTDCAERVVDMLDKTGRPYYIKDDLAKYLSMPKGFWGGGPFCDCGTGDGTHVSEHDPLCLFVETERLKG
jgi:DNA repair photolyase